MFVRTGLRYYGRPCDMSNGTGRRRDGCEAINGRNRNSGRWPGKPMVTDPRRAGARSRRGRLFQEDDGGKVPAASTRTSHSRLLRRSQPVKCRIRMTIATA